MEAKKPGYYDEHHWGNRFPKIQILTAEDLLIGKTAEMPESMKTTFKTSVKKGMSYDNQLEL